MGEQTALDSKSSCTSESTIIYGLPALTHLLCTCRTHHANDLAHGCAPNNRIIYKEHLLPTKNASHCVKLPLNCQLSGPLVRHNEGSAYVAVFYQPLPVREAQLRGDLDSCWARTVRNWHYNVNVP